MSDVVRRAADVLIQHTRTSIEKCHCGWADIGRSHADHVAQALADAGLLATPEHEAAVAARAIEGADDMTLAAELVKRGFLKAELTLDRIEREAGGSE